jgi:transcriptional regulator with XRE-family HTH domain
MSTINERFRKVRDHLNLSQDEFAAMANRTRSEIKNIEYNKTSPKEEVIKAVCAAHGINRKYLELGEEPMLLPDLDDDTEFINDLLAETDNALVDIIRSIMEVYRELDPDGKEKARSFAANLKNKMKENRF